MILRITVNVLRISALLALILGILSWVGNDNFVLIHMVLGILVVLSLSVLGGLMATIRGGIGLAIGAFVLGALVAILGFTQRGLLENNSAHWVIQVLHLLFGLAAIGLGEMIAGRYRRLSTTTA